MKLLLIFMVCSVAFSLHDGRSSENSSVLSPRVARGMKASKGDFPYVGALLIFSGTDYKVCGSSIIKPAWLLTAAQCVKQAKLVKVVLGALELQPPSDGAIIFETNQYYIHENYANNGNSMLNNIALVKLPKEVQFTENIKPIGFGAIGAGKLTSLAGWGITTHSVKDGYSKPNTMLHYTNLGTMSNKECQALWPAINENNLCCRGRGINPCVGDVGSALAVEIDGEWKQVGILIYLTTENDTCVYQPTVFTRTEHFNTWIEETIKRNS